MLTGARGVPVWVRAEVSSLLFGLALLVVLIGLYLWARRRADSIRQQAAQREQAAMAMVLSAPPAAEKPKQKEVEQIDHAYASCSGARPERPLWTSSRRTASSR